jgi:hypothetical protein
MALPLCAPGGRGCHCTVVERMDSCGCGAGGKSARNGEGGLVVGDPGEYGFIHVVGLWI